MRYNQLGRTGLFVSEICLGTMTFGGAETPASGADRRAATRTRSTPSSAARSTPGSTSSTPPTSIPSARSEQLLGQALKNLGVKRKDVVIATKVFGEMGPGPNDRGASRGHIMDCGARPAWSGCRPTTSTSTRSTATTRSRRSRRPCARWTTWCARAWSATSASPTGRPGRSPRRWASAEAQGLGPLRDPAGLLLHRRPRPGARARPDAEAPRQLGLMVWSPLAGGLLSGKFGPGAEQSARARAAPIFDFPPVDKDRAWTCVDADARDRRRARRLGGPRGAGLAAAPSRAVMSVIIGAKTHRAARRQPRRRRPRADAPRRWPGSTRSAACPTNIRLDVRPARAPRASQTL